MDIKDRIRIIMEDKHMTQQVFADFLQQSPATLSSIFNGRTRPTLNIIDSIKTKIPDISIEWLLYGTGDMYISHPEASNEGSLEGQNSDQEPTLYLVLSMIIPLNRWAIPPVVRLATRPRLANALPKRLPTATGKRNI